MRIVIDTYNALHTTGILPPELDGLDVPGLVDLLSRGRWSRNQVLLVCDGTLPRGHRDIRCGGIGTIHSGPDKEADDIIEEIIARSDAPLGMLIISSDTRVVRAARRRKCHTMPSKDFLQTLRLDHELAQHQRKRRKDAPRLSEKLSVAGGTPVTRLFLDSFKGFSQPTEVPLGPITLLFGENSAGKSSILQSLYIAYMTDFYRAHEPGSGKLKANNEIMLNGPIADLGNLSELACCSRKDDDVSIGWEYGFKRPSQNFNALGRKEETNTSYYEIHASWDPTTGKMTDCKEVLTLPTSSTDTFTNIPRIAWQAKEGERAVGQEDPKHAPDKIYYNYTGAGCPAEPLLNYSLRVLEAEATKYSQHRITPTGRKAKVAKTKKKVTRFFKPVDETMNRSREGHTFEHLDEVITNGLLLTYESWLHGSRLNPRQQTAFRWHEHNAGAVHSWKQHQYDEFKKGKYSLGDWYFPGDVFHQFVYAITACKILGSLPRNIVSTQFGKPISFFAGTPSAKLLDNFSLAGLIKDNHVLAKFLDPYPHWDGMGPKGFAVGKRDSIDNVVAYLEDYRPDLNMAERNGESYSDLLLPIAECVFGDAEYIEEVFRLHAGSSPLLYIDEDALGRFSDALLQHLPMCMEDQAQVLRAQNVPGETEGLNGFIKYDNLLEDLDEREDRELFGDIHRPEPKPYPLQESKETYLYTQPLCMAEGMQLGRWLMQGLAEGKLEYNPRFICWLAVCITDKSGGLETLGKLEDPLATRHHARTQNIVLHQLPADRGAPPSKPGAQSLKFLHPIQEELALQVKCEMGTGPKPYTINHWLSKLGTGYMAEVETGVLFGEQHERVIFKDNRFLDKNCAAYSWDENEPVIADGIPYSNLGYGISQVLPVIQLCMARQDSTLVIQEPENSLHPRFQADLGSLFFESCRDRGNQLIIETHSEHLVLRMLRLVREGYLDPDDLCVLYVSRDKTGSHVQRLEVDSDGEFIDEWPDGFFMERSKEILGSNPLNISLPEIDAMKEQGEEALRMLEEEETP